MSKPMVGDKVVVMRSRTDVDGRFVAGAGVLTEVDRGAAIVSKKARAKEGPCPVEVTVPAEGWAVLVTDAGDRVCFPMRELRHDTVAMRQESVATMGLVVALEKTQAEAAAKVSQARTDCGALGLDVETLTDDNCMKIAALFNK